MTNKQSQNGREGVSNQISEITYAKVASLNAYMQIQWGGEPKIDHKIKWMRIFHEMNEFWCKISYRVNGWPLN